MVRCKAFLSVIAREWNGGLPTAGLPVANCGVRIKANVVKIRVARAKRSLPVAGHTAWASSA
jgi:hypothetical protein